MRMRGTRSLWGHSQDPVTKPRGPAYVPSSRARTMRCWVVSISTMNCYGKIAPSYPMCRILRRCVDEVCPLPLDNVLILKYSNCNVHCTVCMSRGRLLPDLQLDNIVIFSFGGHTFVPTHKKMDISDGTWHPTQLPLQINFFSSK